MSIGYACLGIGIPGSDAKTTTMKYASPERLEELIRWNLSSVKQLLTYNIHHEIRLFRISSDIIPFGSSPVNSLNWTEMFWREWEELARMIRQGNLRVSMHPGQYTVLNSPDGGVVERAVKDLEYHNQVLTNLGVDSSHKIILHVGGGYGDKAAAMARFQQNYHKLSNGIKDRLVLENDDRIYNIAEVLELAETVKAPVVFDNLHHQVNPPKEERSEKEWIMAAHNTWHTKDGLPKIHYSQSNPHKKSGSHSETIDLTQFLEYYHRLSLSECDIMLEVKDKNLSAVKCINGTRQRSSIKHLEKEWALYKYTVLERSPMHYEDIRALLKDKEAYPVEKFYQLLDEALNEKGTQGTLRNGFQHVWGYLKNMATEEEKEEMSRQLQRWEEGKNSLATLKKKLFVLVEKYQQSYLLASYYFVL